LGTKFFSYYFLNGLTNKNHSYIVTAMNNNKMKNNCVHIDEKVHWFIDLCKKNGLKVTPQRIEIYKGLINTDEHPSAETLYAKVRKTFPNISLDTVNRTLLTLSEIGAAQIVEGSGDVRRFDGGMEKHQHFKCIKCKRIIDFNHKPFNNIKLPVNLDKKFKILKKVVYLEGICDLCK
jgi:Fur family peroxide stress response transcriptional regulator